MSQESHLLKYIRILQILLENDTEKLPYYEVTRRFLLGVCYYRIGKEEQGKECMEYVIGHGNTLKCKEEAEKYVTV